MDEEYYPYSQPSISYEDAVKEGVRRIIFTGPTRSGKSSIEKVIFHKLSPHETLFLDSTHGVDIHSISNNDFISFQTWDFGGDAFNLGGDIDINGIPVSSERVIKNASTLVYIIDAQENDFEDALPKLVETLITVHQINPNIFLEIFLHKIDGDHMPDENKQERYQFVSNFVTSELNDYYASSSTVVSSGLGAGSGTTPGFNNGNNQEILVNYYLTSIYDHSALEAFSKVIQKLVPQLPVLNSLMDKLVESSMIEKSYLLDVFTKLYIATDSNPVDGHSYELCADLVDLVIDVSCIYGLYNKNDSNSSNSSSNSSSNPMLPIDSSSMAAARLADNGPTLFFCEVGKYLSLVCVTREAVLEKRSLLDYNIKCFRKSLESVMKECHQEN